MVCGASHDNCLAFGEGAIFVADRKMGRLIDKAEALRIVQRAEEEGLVHCSANTSEELAFICNCCSCHCGILSQAKRFPHASRVLTSGYQARVRADRCGACETCAQRCPMKAIAMNEAAEVQPLQCIGCGLCVGACPTEAMEMIPRPDVPIPPKKMGDLERAVRKTKGVMVPTAGSH